MRRKASITVFAALSLMLVAQLLFTLLEAARRDIQNRKYAWKALEQLFTVGALTEVQKRRFRLYVFQGLSTRQIGRMEGTSHQAVAKSINLAIAKLKKYFAAQG